MREIKQIGDFVKERVDKNARIIFGVVIDNRMNNKFRIVVLASGIKELQPTEEKIRDVIDFEVPAFIRRKASVY
jgi:cell division GTPase FtsZ